MAKIVENTSGLHPLGAAILAEPYEPEFKSSRIVIPDTALERSMMVETRVRILEIGPNAWKNEPARAEVGDIVMISKLAGSIAVGPKDGKKYRIINADDAFLRIEE